APGAFTIRVLTCNAGGRDLRPGALAELIAATPPDVVALQEGSVRSLPTGSWPARRHPPTARARRYPLRKGEELAKDAPGRAGFGTRFDLETPGGLVHFFNLHLETVREGLEAVLLDKCRPWRGAPDLRANIELRARESEAASRWVREVSGPVLIAGDFNLPAD